MFSLVTPHRASGEPTLWLRIIVKQSHLTT
jgi:hypothetical protein